MSQKAEVYLTETGTTDHVTNDLNKTATWKAKKLKLKYNNSYNKLAKVRWKRKVYWIQRRD